MLVIGIARRVIDALVVRAGLDVGEGSGKDITVVGDAIGVGVNRGSGVGGETGIARPGGSLVPVDRAMRGCDAKAPRRDKHRTNDD